MINIKLLSEHGYEESMLGLSLSHKSTVERAKQIAPNLAHKQGGHNKFTEMIMMWFDVELPRHIWQELDTYRVGITKQSESTIHTITKGELTQDDFDMEIFEPTLDYLNALIEFHNSGSIEGADKKGVFLTIKNNLPEGFLQRRIIMVSYKTFQNIYNQRKAHKMPHWKVFLEKVLSEIEHPEFIVPLTK